MHAYYLWSNNWFHQISVATYQHNEDQSNTEIEKTTIQCPYDVISVIILYWCCQPCWAWYFSGATMLNMFNGLKWIDQLVKPSTAHNIQQWQMGQWRFLSRGMWCWYSLSSPNVHRQLRGVSSNAMYTRHLNINHIAQCLQSNCMVGSSMRWNFQEATIKNYLQNKRVPLTRKDLLG